MPIVLAYATSSLNHEFGLDAIPSTAIPRMVEFMNGLNVVSLKQSVKSIISNGFLKSGLSVPYFSIASLYGILLNG